MMSKNSQSEGSKERLGEVLVEGRAGASAFAGVTESSAQGRCRTGESDYQLGKFRNAKEDRGA